MWCCGNTVEDGDQDEQTDRVNAEKAEHRAAQRAE
jgi:hypothetical protein